MLLAILLKVLMLNSTCQAVLYTMSDSVSEPGKRPDVVRKCG